MAAQFAVASAHDSAWFADAFYSELHRLSTYGRHDMPGCEPWLTPTTGGQDSSPSGSSEQPYRSDQHDADGFGCSAVVGGVAAVSDFLYREGEQPGVEREITALAHMDAHIAFPQSAPPFMLACQMASLGPDHKALLAAPGHRNATPSAHAQALQSQEVTTLMIRNVPTRVSQKQLLEELSRGGFGGLFDFVYLPCSFASRESKGYAFINFTSTTYVGPFVESWHNRKVFGNHPHEPPLNVSAATVQGLQANIQKWSSRVLRIRNPELKPHIVSRAALQPSASSKSCWPEGSGSSGSGRVRGEGGDASSAFLGSPWTDHEGGPPPVRCVVPPPGLEPSTPLEPPPGL